MIPTTDDNPTMKIWLNLYNTIATGEYWLIPRFTAKQVLKQPTDKYTISMGTGTFVLEPFTMNQLLNELTTPTITIDKNQGYALADTLMTIGNNDEPTNILYEELELTFPGYHDHATNRFK